MFTPRRPLLAGRLNRQESRHAKSGLRRTGTRIHFGRSEGCCRHRFLRTFAYGTDASFYRLDPQIVVIVESETQILGVLRLSRLYSRP